jgi:hypothetical protein
MRLERYRVQNVMRITELEVDTSQNALVLIGGKNGHGKTSALCALLMTLCGKRGMEWPDVPLKEGESHGECEVNLSLAGDGSDSDVFPDMESITIKRTWDRQRDGSIKESLTITDESGQKSAAPQDILNSLFRSRALDPLSLESVDAKKQRKMLMDLVGLTDEWEQLQIEYQEAYDERTTVNRQGQALKSQLDGMVFVDDAPEAEITVSALLDELNAIEKHNAEAIRHKDGVDVMSRQVDEAVADVERKKKSLENAEAMLKYVRVQLVGQKKIADGFSFQETDEIRAKIDTVEADNAAVRANQRYTEIEEQLEALRTVRDGLQEQVEAIPARQQELLAGADWPVKGLSVDEDGVLYQGLPVAQASLAERIRLWCRVSVALKPKLKLLVFHDGNALDYTSMQELDDFLKESECQAIVEFVTRNTDDENHCVVVLEEGHAREALGATV